MEPSSTRRDKFEKGIASRCVFELLWGNILCFRVSDMCYYYGLIRTSAIMAAGAGWVFELRMHQLLRKQQTIRMFPITPGRPEPANFIYEDYPGRNPIDLHLTRSDEYPLAEGNQFHANLCHRPTPTNFPGIDPCSSFTRNAGEHDVNEDDLNLSENIQKYCGGHTRKTSSGIYNN